jgi:hypothetical protein
MDSEREKAGKECVHTNKISTTADALEATSYRKSRHFILLFHEGEKGRSYFLIIVVTVQRSECFQCNF